MRNAGKNIKATINLLSVSYNDEGPTKGAPIVFIHGFPFNKSMWDVQAELLRDEYRVISYDVRGHGRSDFGTGNFSIDMFASDLIFLIETLKLEKVVLCGLSMGGYIALNAVLSHPDRFAGLILCDTQCTADDLEMKEKRIKAMENILKNGVKAYAEDTIPNLFAPSSLTSKEEEVGLVREMILQTSSESLCTTLSALSRRKETCDRLAEISVPTLILVGKEDKITPPSAAEFMHEQISGSQLVAIPHAGHLSNLENPAVFNRELKKFMTQFATRSAEE